MSNFGEGNPYYGNGGGFVQGGSQGGSQDSPGGGRKNKSQSIRPVTVKQLLEASQLHNDAEHTIDGHEVQQILLVGSVHNKSQNATSVMYEVGDGTGYIDVRQWLDTADDEGGKTDGIEQDGYIAIMGTIKVFGNKKHVAATHIRPIKDHNEVFNHILRAVYVTLSLRNPGGGGGGAAATSARHGDYSAGAATSGPDTSNYAHLPPIQRQVMEIVAADTGDDGMHVQAISRAAGGNAGVMDAIEHLMQEGMLYSTIDDLHVKAM